MRGSIQSFLRLVLQVTNGCLLVLGLVLGLSSLFLLLQFEKERREADPVSTPPPPVSPGTPAPPAPDIDHILATEPWFLYAFIGAGAYIVLTASVGLCGADRGNRCCLSLYTYLSGVQLLGQLALAVALFAGSNVSPPPDVTGAEAKAWRLVRSHVPLARWFTVGVLAVQILSVLLAASLARVKRVALYDSEDDEDDDGYYERTYGGSRGQRRPLLNRSEEDGGVGGGGYRSEEGGGGETDAAEISSPGSPSRTARRDEWSRRMREKYGLDTSRFSYDPERPPPSRRGDVEGRDEEGGGRCAVM